MGFRVRDFKLVKVPPGKNPSTSVGFEPANLGSRTEHVTPRPKIIINNHNNINIIINNNNQNNNNIIIINNNNNNNLNSWVI